MTHSVKNAQNVAETADIVVDELTENDYPTDIPATPEDAENVHRWSAAEVREAQREKTRTDIAMRLVTMFSCLLAGNYVLTGVAAFLPNADRAFIKENSSQATTPLAGLLGVALGYYFGRAKED